MKSTLVFQKLVRIIEALLFAAREPLTVKQIKEILGLQDEAINNALEELVEEYKERGIKVYKVAHGYVLGTDPEFAEFVDRLQNFPVETRLSPQALEALAIIAYKQPVTKPEIERIRGVFSDGVIETLLNRRLIEEKGRSEAPGRPILYATTTEFLKHFGIKDLNHLPPHPVSEEPKEHPYEGILREEELPQKETA